MDNYWETAFDAISDFVSLHTTDHKIVKANKSVCDNVNIPIGQIIGKPCYEILFGTETICDNCPLEKTLQTNKVSTEEITKGEKTFLVTTTPLLNDNGLFGVIHVVKDVTQFIHKWKSKR